MRKRELDRFQKALSEKREQLLELTAKTAGEGRNTISEGGDDYVDDAVTHYNREFLLSLSDLERRQLLMVEEAIARIRSGEYGECLNCGEKIAIRRLGAVPWARYCKSCQELSEREELSDFPRRDMAEEETQEEAPTPKAQSEEE